MKFSLSDSFRVFFAENKIIELENVISSEDIDSLITRSSWKDGRNLWKKSESHKKILTKSKAGEIIAFLLKKKPIRLAYSQILNGNPSEDSPFPEAK